jgi:hypothetical protein
MEESSSGKEDIVVEVVPTQTLCPPSETADTIHTRSAKLQISSIHSPDRSHVHLDVRLSTPTQTVTLRAMIDSGATGNFINTSLVKQHHLELEKLSAPLKLTVIDGRSIESGQLTHATGPVTLTAGDHSETMRLFPTALDNTR